MEYMGFHTICCNVICCDWAGHWMSWLVMFIHMLLCMHSFSFFHWLDLIRCSLITRYNMVLSRKLKVLSLITYSLFFIPFNNLFWCYSLHLHLEDGERQLQQNSEEYNWLGSDLEQNNLGQYILIHQLVLFTLTCMV